MLYFYFDTECILLHVKLWFLLTVFFNFSLTTQIDWQCPVKYTHPMNICLNGSSESLQLTFIFLDLLLKKRSYFLFIMGNFSSSPLVSQVSITQNLNPSHMNSLCFLDVHLVHIFLNAVGSACKTNCSVP